jgi:hypothetical protein
MPFKKGNKIRGGPPRTDAQIDAADLAHGRVPKTRRRGGRERLPDAATSEVALAKLRLAMETTERRRKPVFTDEEMEAIKSAKIRLPKEASDVEAMVARYGFARICEVMAGTVGYRKAPSILKAAVLVREEICGPVARTINMEGGLTLEALVGAAGQVVESAKVLPTPAQMDEGAI